MRVGTEPTRSQGRPLVALLCVAGALSGCAGGMYAGGFDLPAQPVARAGVLELRWRRPLNLVTDLEHRPSARSGLGWDAARQRVIAAGVDGGLYALRGVDSAEVWRFEGLARFDGTPTVDGEDVFLGAADGALYALEASRGALRWRFSTASDIVHPPVVRDDVVYFVNSNDTVFALDRATGALRWRYRRNPAGGISLSGHAGLRFERGRIYTAFSDGVLVSLDARDGSVVWQQDTSADLENIDERNEAHEAIDCDATPVLVGDTVFGASFTAGVYALDAVGGGRRWRLDDVLGVVALGTDGRYLYASSGSQGLLKIDPFDGRVLWSRDLGSRLLGAAEPLAGNPELLLVPAADRGLWVVRAADGEPVEGLLPGRGISGAPVQVGRWIFARSAGAVVYALRSGR